MIVSESAYCFSLSAGLHALQIILCGVVIGLLYEPNGNSMLVSGDGSILADRQFKTVNHVASKLSLMISICTIPTVVCTCFLMALSNEQLDTCKIGVIKRMVPIVYIVLIMLWISCGAVEAKNTSLWSVEMHRLHRSPLIEHQLKLYFRRNYEFMAAVSGLCFGEALLFTMNLHLLISLAAPNEHQIISSV